MPRGGARYHPGRAGIIGAPAAPPAGAALPVTAGLALHLDADDASTFTLDVARLADLDLPAPVAAGTFVSEWRDKSPAARHAVMPTQGFRPTRDGTLGTRTAVRYLNVQQVLRPPIGFASAFTAGELFVALALISTGGTLARFHSVWSPSIESFYPYVDGTVYEGWGSTVRHTLGIPPVALTTPHVYNLRTAANSYVAAFNGTDFYTSAANAVAFGTAQYEIGSHFHGPASNCNLGEYVVYNRVLSAAERGQVLDYLRTKWSTP